MTRDMDLIRELLLKLEAIPIRPGGILHIPSGDKEVAVDGYDTTQIDYHLSLIKEAGLIDDGGARPMVGIGFRRLSWAGHDFLDATRDKTVWEKTKDTATRAGGFSLDLLVSIAKEIIKQNVAKLTGSAVGF